MTSIRHFAAVKHSVPGNRAPCPNPSAPLHYGSQVEAQLLHGWPALLDHDGYGVHRRADAGRQSRDLVEQAAQHAVSIRRAMSNNRFQKAIVPELEAL